MLLFGTSRININHSTTFPAFFFFLVLPLANDRNACIDKLEDSQEIGNSSVADFRERIPEKSALVRRNKKWGKDIDKDIFTLANKVR